MFMILHLLIYRADILENQVQGTARTQKEGCKFNPIFNYTWNAI